ncbi:MAG: hypothetical protein ACMXX9_02775 [Candidatus Woesearchaeota archaeon]
MKYISGRSQGVHVFTNKNTGVLFGKYNFLMNSKFFLDKKLDFDSVLMYRKTVFNAQNSFNKFNDKIKEAGLSIKPIELDIGIEKLKQKDMDRETMPVGMSGKLHNLTIKENVKVPRFVDKIVNDDLKAEKSVNKLYERGFDNDYVSQLFSTSNLGSLKDRKFVPTRWSITATDDIISKNILLNDDSESEILFFEGEYMSNNFFVLIFPGKFEYELIEKFGDQTATDYESAFGRKNYASNTTGGYYAAKLGVMEYLKNHNLEGRVLVIRIVNPQYRKSLGVWVVREAVRKTMNKSPKRFKNVEEIKKYAKIYIADVFLKLFPQAISESKILNNSLKQTNLALFTR